MDFNKAKGGNQDSDGPRRSGSGNTGERRTIDARPNGNADMAAPSGPRNIRETRAWQEGTAGAKRMWWNYKQMLIDSFNRLPRASQEQLITQICMIVTIGTSLLLISFFYSFLPQLIRVIGLPLAGIGAWWAGTRIVAPIMIVRYDEYLNKNF